MGLRRMIGQFLRNLSARMLPFIAYVSLIFGRHRRVGNDPGQVIEIRQRGSEVTVVSFAGIAALHGGMVNYEFTELLRKLSWEPNVVFVRDPLCACYHLRPDGTPGGLDYYAEAVESAVRSTGAKHVVAIGTSIGGMAALTFGSRLAFDQVIAFSPTWPPERYFLDGSARARLERIRLLFREPGVFFERLLLAQMARVSARRLERTVGRENILDLEKALASSTTLPRISMMYGRGCAPDVATAEALHRITGAEIVALDTSMHNSTAHLKRTGQLVPAILERVDSCARARGLVPARAARSEVARPDRAVDATPQTVAP